MKRHFDMDSQLIEEIILSWTGKNLDRLNFFFTVELLHCACLLTLSTRVSVMHFPTWKTEWPLASGVAFVCRKKG